VRRFVLAATAVIVLAATAVFVLSASGVAAVATPKSPCASYPKPGSVAPAGTPTPRGMAAEYSVLKRPRAAADHITRAELGPSLSASGVILGGARLLGKAAFGGRVYAVPAEHVLAYPHAPVRCVPVAQRSTERSLLRYLRRQYRHRALCVVIVYRDHALPTCGAAPGTLDPLLFTAGVPAYGLVPDGIAAVKIRFHKLPSRRVEVHGNFWIVNDPTQPTLACGVDWLDPQDVVLRVPASCSQDLS
jgi:hypothetical protein